MKRFATLSVLLLTLIYFAGGAYLLRFELDRLLLPTSALEALSTEDARFSVTNSEGAELLIRHYRALGQRCVVFFPGQHGGLTRYEQTLFPTLTAASIDVFALSYPGHDGAAGHASLPELQRLLAQSLAQLNAHCPRQRTVFYGRSLGSMLAAFSAAQNKPAGLVLEAATPSLAQAIRQFLEAKVYLKPLSLLPVERLLANNYRLSDALQAASPLPVAIFQGSADTQTPLTTLRAAPELAALAQIRTVPGGTHSTGYQLAMGELLAVIRQMTNKPATQ